MARISQITLAKPAINKHFKEAARTIYSANELGDLLKGQRSAWHLARHTNTAEFISFLETENILHSVTFQATAYARKIVRYCFGEPSKFQLAQSVAFRGYLTHASAIRLHKLNDTDPKVQFLNVEQSPKPKSTRSSLTQQSIDRAFVREQRQSNLTYRYKDLDVTVLSGKYTNRLAVETILGDQSEILDVTSVERTLIDIVVRPAYAGGIAAVLSAFRAAIGRVSPQRIVSVLRELDYVYPYHQSIGFLLQRSGYSRKDVAPLWRMRKHLDFYLVHGSNKLQFDPEWKLYFPKQLLS